MSNILNKYVYPTLLATGITLGTSGCAEKINDIIPTNPTHQTDSSNLSEVTIINDMGEIELERNFTPHEIEEEIGIVDKDGNVIDPGTGEPYSSATDKLSQEDKYIIAYDWPKTKGTGGCNVDPLTGETSGCPKGDNNDTNTTSNVAGNISNKSYKA